VNDCAVPSIACYRGVSARRTELRIAVRPGLLQMEDCARAIITGVLSFASRDEVERQVGGKVRREEVAAELRWAQET
jgi:hypothetical protein